MSGNGENYTAGQNFTLPPAVTNLTSADLSHEERNLKLIGTLGKVPILPHAKEQSAH